MSYVNLTLRFADAAQARRELAEYLQDEGMGNLINSYVV